jgi:hypothetical protein
VSSVEARKGKLIKLDEDTWQELLTGEWMVDFYAPWCPACKQLEPQFSTFSTWSDDLGINVASIDVTLNPGLSGRFMVTALPTIYHVKDGVFRQYRGARDSNSFVTFIEEKQWEKLETLSSWKSPDSIQMGIVSCFFKISMSLRNVHNRLVEDYGIPYWGSYILFAFATILLGALLGLLIVCFIDVVFPAKYDEPARRVPDKSAAEDAARKQDKSAEDEATPPTEEAKKDI